MKARLSPSRGSAVRLAAASLCALSLGLTSVGCASADDARASAATSWLTALAGRDAASAYALLGPIPRRKLAELYDVLRDTRDRIVREIPAPNRAATLAATGLAGLTDGGPEALFGELFALSGTGTELGVFGRTGLRPKRLEGDQGQSTVTTLGGDTVSLVQDDTGAWRIALPAEDMAHLEALMATANQNQARVNEALRALGERRYGAK